ncbi:MAG: hypothetical protein Q8928_18430 [Bacteroidota bacterium]|nr:hypothetical protein [Bacteroidota bacterium]
MRQILLCFIVFISIDLRAQWVPVDTSHIHDSVINGIYIPKDIEDCFNELSKPDYGEIKSLLLIISEDSIESQFKGTADFWHNWYFHETSRLTKYFNDLGIMYAKNMQDIILHTYYRRLHESPIRFKEELAKYKDIEAREEKEYQNKFQLDSINGVYIPKNIKECFLQLDKLLTKEDIKQIKSLKSKSETLEYHHSLGMWIRNNWGLWGGSRFQLYMHDRMNDEPDGMSAKVLEFYWEWLNGINENWDKFDKKIK